jgi:hypothetical protein
VISLPQANSGHVLSSEDQRLVWALATLMLDVTGAYGDAVADFLVQRKLTDLPSDEPRSSGSPSPAARKDHLAWNRRDQR